MSTPPRLDTDTELRRLTANGWKIVSDGPSGVQLEAPKQMQGLDKICLAVGILTFWIYGLGLFLIAIAAIDYAFFTKPATKFLPR